ncbi:nuclear transport factor 2 family protein [Streptomyces sp. NPDC051985]|uniref:nuclear transport factor 2 family protein n=1 Tax=Streptomyces sp. NPDC051985 TaxID=3155807 RepID=UPI0034152F34
MSELEEIRRILDLYTYLVDDSGWDRMGEVLTEDVVFTVRGTPVRRQGVAAVVELLSGGASRPLMHLTANVMVDLAPEGGRATARSKVLTPKPDGSAGLVRYEDSLVLTGAGWRIESHEVTPVVGAWRTPGE